MKDLIIRGGENIYPTEVEQFLYTHPKIQDVQVNWLFHRHFNSSLVPVNTYCCQFDQRLSPDIINTFNTASVGAVDRRGYFWLVWAQMTHDCFCLYPVFVAWSDYDYVYPPWVRGDFPHSIKRPSPLPLRWKRYCEKKCRAHQEHNSMT